MILEEEGGGAKEEEIEGGEVSRCGGEKNAGVLEVVESSSMEGEGVRMGGEAARG